MNHTSYTSADFDKQQSAGYTLLVRVGQTADTLAVVDEQAQLKFFAVTNREKPNQEVADLLRCTFGQVKIVVTDQSYSFVPEAVYDADFLPVYQRFLPDDGLIAPQVSLVAPHDIRIIYQLNRLGLEQYTAKFPDAAVYPRIHTYLCGISGHTSSPTPLLAVDKTGDTNVCLCFFNEGKLQYCNDFEIHEPADLHYYMLALLEHIGLTEAKLPILLSGNMVADDAYYKCLTAYSDSLMWADIAALAGVSLPEDLQPNQHQLLSLFGLQLCE